jgi:glycosyltransferase involved in cell wall biosynthesis
MVRRGPLRSRPLAAAELLKMPSFERRMARGYVRCLVSSVEDQQALVADGFDTRGAPLEVLPNGVDERLFACAGVRQPDTLLFVGSMAYAPNVDAVGWFARSVLPLVRRARPAARLRVVGHRADAALGRLARVDGVDLVGPVPAIGPHLAEASVFVAPIRIGGGFSNKVAEALAAGAPTVATPAAFAGINGVVPGEHLLPATGAEELAAQVVRLLGDPALGARLGEAGRRLMAEHHSWAQVVGRLEAVYGEAISSSSAPVTGGPSEHDLEAVPAVHKAVP